MKITSKLKKKEFVLSMILQSLVVGDSHQEMLEFNVSKGPLF